MPNLVGSIFRLLQFPLPSLFSLTLIYSASFTLRLLLLSANARGHTLSVNVTDHSALLHLVRPPAILPILQARFLAHTTASADFSGFVFLWLAPPPRPRGISHTSFIVYSPDLRIKVTVTYLELCCLWPTCPLDTPWYLVPVRRATISLLLLLSQASPLETCKSLLGPSVTTPRVDSHHRCMTCPSYQKMREP